MSRIHVLSPDIANQIAAGEVVERPASLVKELVENALDAGARTIAIDLTEGGRDRVRVADDGCGMSPEDARLAFAPHATSKLTNAEGLTAIATFGFRGEALSSIASVARVSLLTAERDHAEGTRVELEAGAVLVAEPAGAPSGTVVEVRDLFFNTPARRKFLRKAETESAHVQDVVVRLALAHPDVAFTLREEGRVLLQAPAGDRRARIAAALGREVERFLVPVEHARGDMRIDGFCVTPDYSAGSARSIFLFVNRRNVRDRALLHAVNRAYADLLPLGRSGAAVLFLEVPLDRVDVNVHPQKTEVRFAEARAAYDIVLESITRALSRVAPTPLTPEAVARSRVSEVMAQYGGKPASEPFAYNGPSGVTHAAGNDAQPLLQLEKPRGFFGSLRFLGQLDRTYLVCENVGGLVLIDQHAAHERQRFEAISSADRAASAESQRLLVPRTLELGQAAAAAVLAHGEDLAALGFELEGFGGGTLAVTAVPPTLAGRDVAELFGELGQELLSLGRSGAAEATRRMLLATVACHSSVRAGETLTPEEARALLATLDGVDRAARCPHGRPVVFEMAQGELEREFGRDYKSTRRRVET